MSTDAPKQSPLESIKTDSNYLHGTISDQIADPVDHFDKSNIQLLNFETYSACYLIQKRDSELKTRMRYSLKFAQTLNNCSLLLFHDNPATFSDEKSYQSTNC